MVAALQQQRYIYSEYIYSGQRDIYISYSEFLQLNSKT
jgi:hypothetical protein